MRKIVLLMFILILSAAVAGCGGGTGSLFAPIGAVITITPSSDDALTIASTSPVLKSIVQIYQIAVKDFDNTNKGVRDTIFDVTFELTEAPGTTIADLSSLVGLCDGSAIINTLARKQTDGDGIYNLCVVYKTGAGLNYSGNLKILSGQQFVGQAIKVITTTEALTVSPDALTLAAGSSGQFTITGGVPGYTITAVNTGVPAVPSTVSSSGGTFKVTVPVGTAKDTKFQYIVRDSTFAAPITVTVTAGDPPPPIVLPDKASVIAGGTVKFTIIGGVPNYSVFSSNPAIAPVPATVTTNGGTFNVTIPANFPASSTVDITVRDSIGGTVVPDVVITVLSPPNLDVLPASITMDAGATATFAIVGGVPGYTVLSDNPNINPSPSHVDASGGIFNVFAPSDAAGQTATLTVIDTIGKTKTANLTVRAKQAQTITFGAAPTVTVGGTGLVTATASSGLLVSLSSNTPTTCQITGASEVTGKAAGSCEIAANQSGNETYNPAPQATLIITIQP
ncbi:MAG: hypothetical protein HZB33_04220 [Nitrospirae bacterium]|nr:hypothetical protein [Nitrospirota bacterium]